jgi:hypothetical protein
MLPRVIGFPSGSGAAVVGDELAHLLRISPFPFPAGFILSRPLVPTSSPPPFPAGPNRQLAIQSFRPPDASKPSMEGEGGRQAWRCRYGASCACRCQACFLSSSAIGRPVGMAMDRRQERGGTVQFFFAWPAVGTAGNAVRGLHPLNLWWFRLARDNRA